MKHETIKNKFFTEKIKGPCRMISLGDALGMALGWKLFMSKRLAPAGTICNARIYTEHGEFVFSADIPVFESARNIAAVAEEFGIELFIFSETSEHYYWKSSEPEHWAGMYELNGEWITDKGCHFDFIRPQMEKEAKFQQRQWMLDHGLCRRTPKEFFNDLFWSVKYKCKKLKREIKGYLYLFFP